VTGQNRTTFSHGRTRTKFSSRVFACLRGLQKGGMYCAPIIQNTTQPAEKSGNNAAYW